MYAHIKKRRTILTIHRSLLIKKPGGIVRYPPGLRDLGVFLGHGSSTPMLLNSSVLNWARNNSAPARTMSKTIKTAVRIYMVASSLILV
jgi:hypothetical protein